MFAPLLLTFGHSVWLWLLPLLIPMVALGYVFGRKRGIVPVSIWLRIAALGALILALAQPFWSLGSAAPATVIVVDRSASVAGPVTASVGDWLDTALEAAGAKDRAAIVSFGGNTVLTNPVGLAHELHYESNISAVDPETTDIASALSMARVLPVGENRRIVLISDGAENSGSALEQAAQAAADGVPIDVLPVDGIGERDLRIDQIAAPTTIWQGESWSVQIGIQAPEIGTGTIGLLVDGQETIRQDVEFQRGSNTSTYTIDDLAPGFHRLEVVIDPGSAYDVISENNAREFGVVVRAAPHVLMIEQTGPTASILGEALVRQGVQLTAIPPTDIPERLSELNSYDAIVLVDVPAEALSIGQIAALQQATQSLGRGLIVVGGTSAYGPGSYANTPLEDLLPVDVKITEGKERQRVALLLVIDKSGSMATGPGGSVPKIDMAKEAAQLAAGVLLDGDEIAILAFNDRQQWIVRLTMIQGQADRTRIDMAVEELKADGGTEIYPALDVGFDEISKSDADIRHIVLLSDGRSSSGTRESYTGLVERMGQMGTTLSTIGIGNDADTELLQYLAALGRGRYHAAATPEDIPRLTLQEAQSAGSQSVVRGDFRPIQTDASPIMAGFEPSELPLLAGYDYVEIKTGARAVLTSDRNDPILATWQYGLGRVVAWTADDGVDFAHDWTDWDGFGKFWLQIVHWALPDPERGAIEVQTERRGSDALMTLSVPSDGTGSFDSESSGITIVAPDGSVVDGIAPYRSAPGEWQLRIPNPQAGAWQLEVELADGTNTISPFTVPVSAELEPDPDATALMQQLAARTGGRVLSLDEPEALFAVASERSDGNPTWRAVWSIPLSLSLIFVLLELAYRYRVFDRWLLHRP